MAIVKTKLYSETNLDDIIYPETSLDQIVANYSGNSGVLYITPGKQVSTATLTGKTTFYYTTVALYGSKSTLNFKAYFRLFLTKSEYDKLFSLQGQPLALEIYNILKTKSFVSQNHYVSVPATGNFWWTTGGDSAIFSISADGHDNFIFECAGYTTQIAFSKDLTSADCRLHSYTLDTNISIVQ